jgi:hypothetical protein
MALTNNCVLAKDGNRALAEATANVQPGDRITITATLVVAENLTDRISGDVESVQVTSGGAVKPAAPAPAAKSGGDFASGLLGAMSRRSNRKSQ